MAGFLYEKRVTDRIEQCVKLGMQYSAAEHAYIKDPVYIPIMDIKVLGDDKWNSLMEGAKARLENNK